MIQRITFTAAFLFSAAFTMTSVQAGGCGGCYGGLAGGGFPGIAGYGVNLLPYSLGQVPVPPYFALHPPVYYSAPVPRTYGHSPYAYPGTFRTPEIEAATPAMIENPHAKTTKANISDKSVQAAPEIRSQMVMNPYVKQTVAAR